ncbi:MAG: DeoR/GlpR family DNA-binding transcription regulator [Nocardioidaceae bacterium]
MDEFQREQRILSALQASGRVLVNDLAEQFGVSTVTVRKDLDALEQRSLVRRVRGGAVSTSPTDEGAFEMRTRHAAHAKEAIGRSVGPVVEHGDVIAMDSSTTCFYLAHQLLDRRNLVVVTNGLRVANLFMERSTAMVLMPGGVLRRSAGSMVGPIGDILAGRGQIDKGFFGVVGLSTTHGLMDLAVEEAQTKKFLAQACRTVYAVFDSTKADRFALHSFADLDQITALYTDSGISDAFVEDWTALGIDVHVTTLDSSAGSAEGDVRKGER